MAPKITTIFLAHINIHILPEYSDFVFYDSFPLQDNKKGADIIFEQEKNQIGKMFLPIKVGWLRANRQSKQLKDSSISHIVRI
jgi:hypothetical protein